MYFRQLLHDHTACASYLVGCPTLGVCAVVDPQGDSFVYSSAASSAGMTITDVFETHLHADHLSCAAELAEIAGATLWFGSGAPVAFDHREMRDGAPISVGNRRIIPLRTPGHTPEHTCLLVDDWFVLTGDCLFVGDVGRVDLEERALDPAEIAGRAEALHASLTRLFTLPDHTEIFPGHYAGSVCGRGLDGKCVSTIGRERRYNSAARLDLAGFVRFQLENRPLEPKAMRETKARNSGFAIQIADGHAAQ